MAKSWLPLMFFAGAHFKIFSPFICLIHCTASCVGKGQKCDIIKLTIKVNARLGLGFKLRRRRQMKIKLYDAFKLRRKKIKIKLYIKLLNI